MANEIRGPLPVKVDATSNGEFRPVPLTKDVARANIEAELRIGENAKRIGMGRRAFLQSLCGAATTLLTLNEAFAALGNTGGLFRVRKEGALETAAAAEALASQVDGDQLDQGVLFPPIEELRQVTRQIAAAVVRAARDAGVGRVIDDAEVDAAVAYESWDLDYPTLRPV